MKESIKINAEKEADELEGADGIIYEVIKVEDDNTIELPQNSL